MPAAMSPAKREKLQAALDYVAQQERNQVEPAAIIAGLVADYGAIERGWNPYTLRVAGVVSSCTSSKDKGLLAAWKRLATVRIMQENMQ